MKFNLKKLGVITALGMILSAGLCFVLMKFAVEPQTGFFYREYHTLGVATCLLIFIIAAICMLVAALTKKAPNLSPAPCKSFGIGSIIMAAAVIYESLFTQVGATIPSWQTLLQVSFGLFCAAIFILGGLTEFGVSAVPEGFDVAFIIFWLLRVMIVFSNSIASSILFENVFEVAALCSILVFFLVSAKMRNRIPEDGKYGGVLPMAIFTLLICTAYSVPQVIVKFISTDTVTKSTGATFVSDLACAVYIITFIIKYFADRKAPEIPQEEPAEEGENGNEIPEVEAPEPEE
ncbi:MAG: hypothetical protein KBS52_04590 [Clostridiales bacterium]|nr:hypothetical protein [Candidatus Equinaster intestinalis]